MCLPRDLMSATEKHHRPGSSRVFRFTRRWVASGPSTERQGDALAAFDPEWLISAGRLVTALFAVVAVYLDPTQPAQFSQIAKLVLGGYAVFALVIAMSPVRKPLNSKFHLLSHGVDIVVLGGLASLTNELTSPFFAFLPFILLATTMRWGMSGAIVGAAVLETVLILIGLPDLEDGDSELNVLIMRSAYFIVAAVMLGYFGASRDRSRERLARLADWPSDSLTNDRTVWLKSIIQHAAEVLGDPRLIIVWEDQDEPKESVGYWGNGTFQLVDVANEHSWRAQSLERPPSLDWFGDEPSRIEQAHLLLKSVPGLETQDVSPIRRAYSATFSGLRYRGCLLVLDPACHPEESVLLTNIIAARIGAELERLALLQHVSITARSQERVRLGRDLHDSILQDLTAAGLKLKAIAGCVPDKAKSDFAVVSELLLDQQRRIRMFVESVNLFEHFDQTVLSGALHHCTASLQRQWNCVISLTVNPPDAKISTSISREVVQFISEATANAVRHGEATTIDIEAVRSSRELLLRITDNGRGIVSGKAGEQKEPISLSARVTDLGGILSLSDRSPGLEICVRLPVSEDAAL